MKCKAVSPAVHKNSQILKCNTFVHVACVWEWEWEWIRLEKLRVEWIWRISVFLDPTFLQ